MIKLTIIIRGNDTYCNEQNIDGHSWEAIGIKIDHILKSLQTQTIEKLEVDEIFFRYNL